MSRRRLDAEEVALLHALAAAVEAEATLSVAACQAAASPEMTRAVGRLAELGDAVANRLWHDARDRNLLPPVEEHAPDEDHDAEGEEDPHGGSVQGDGGHG